MTERNSDSYFALHPCMTTRTELQAPKLLYDTTLHLAEGEPVTHGFAYPIGSTWQGTWLTPTALLTATIDRDTDGEWDFHSPPQGQVTNHNRWQRTATRRTHARYHAHGKDVAGWLHYAYITIDFEDGTSHTPVDPGRSYQQCQLDPYRVQELWHEIDPAANAADEPIHRPDKHQKLPDWNSDTSEQKSR